MSTIRGLFIFLILTLNTVLLCVPLYPIVLLKLIPHRRWRLLCTRAARRLARGWVAVAVAVFRRTGTSWEIEKEVAAERGGRYLLLCNHQSWVDIPALLVTFGNRLPFPVFIVKRELLWFPLVGGAMWGLDYPFVRRYSKEEVERRPELRGRDRETARRACEKSGDLPTTFVVFPEGTRFSPEKRLRVGSPYAHLLPPRSGGVRTVFESQQALLSGILDVTVAYHGGKTTFWGFLCGRLPGARVAVRQPPFPEQNEPIEIWLDRLWRHKENILS